MIIFLFLLNSCFALPMGSRDPCKASKEALWPRRSSPAFIRNGRKGVRSTYDRKGLKFSGIKVKNIVKITTEFTDKRCSKGTQNGRPTRYIIAF